MNNPTSFWRRLVWALASLVIITYVFGCGSASNKANSNPVVTPPPPPPVVTPATPAPTVTLTATPGSIVAGSSSTLTVAASNDTQLLISGSDGTSYPMAATGGAQVVSPTSTTTYTADASGEGGEVSANTTVTVTPAPVIPTVKLTAAPSSITAGDASTLTVVSTGANSTTITGSDGSSYDLPAAGGTKDVSPTETTTYTATAVGADSTVTSSAIVTVQPAPPPPVVTPTVSFTSSSFSVVAGTSLVLTVIATNGTDVTITGTDGSSYTLPKAGGDQSVTPAATTTYTATVTGEGISVSAAITITVTQPPLAPVGTVAGSLQKNNVQWDSYGQHGPKYIDCSPSPCQGISWSEEYGITNPSLSNDATEFDLGGTTAYGDALFTTEVIGSHSVLKDASHTLLPTLHNFTYETDFYVTNLSITETLEFDISLYMSGTKLVFGTQCSHKGDNSWDIYDNVKGKWLSAGIPCKMVDGWNHLIINVSSDSANNLLYNSITLDGVKYNINHIFPPGHSSPSWWGLTVNFQMDGDAAQDANKIYVDNLSLTYW